jgi:hypothetical protein
MAERGVDVSYETVRRCFIKFGLTIAANLRRTRPRPSDCWHLDEMVVVMNGRWHWLWRAVDNEGEVLDFLVQPRRHAGAARTQAATVHAGRLSATFPRRPRRDLQHFLSPASPAQPNRLQGPACQFVRYMAVHL